MVTERAMPCIERFKAARLHGIGVAIIGSGVEFVLDEGCPDDDILMLRQLRLAANAAVGITGYRASSSRGVRRRAEFECGLTNRPPAQPSWPDCARNGSKIRLFICASS